MRRGCSRRMGGRFWAAARISSPVSSSKSQTQPERSPSNSATSRSVACRASRRSTARLSPSAMALRICSSRLRRTSASVVTVGPHAKAQRRNEGKTPKVKSIVASAHDRRRDRQAHGRADRCGGAFRPSSLILHPSPMRYVGPVRGTPRATLVAVTLATFTDMLLYGVVVPVLTGYAEGLAVAEWAPGALFGAHSVSLLGATAYCGALSDRV